MSQPAASFAYIETTIAPGKTVSDYRRSRRVGRRRHLWARRTSPERNSGRL
jgi:hypothetical protein